MSRWSVGLVLFLSAASSLSLPATAEDRLRVVVGPRLSYEPASVRVTSYVQPDAENRRLVVEADSGEHFSSSDRPLAGDRQSLANIIWLKNLPAGKYEVRVRLEHSRGHDVIARGTFVVIGERR